MCHGVVRDFNRPFGVGISRRYFYGGSFGLVFLLLGSLGLDFFVC